MKSKPAIVKDWRNAIVGHGEEAPDQLLANPLNWHVHTTAQQAALAGAVNDVGFIRSVTVNRTTGHVVDGHLRIQLAMRSGVKTIPVEYVELSEVEEAEALATLDPLAAMAATDAQQLDALLSSVQASDEAVQQLLAELAKDNRLYIEPETIDAEPQIDKADELRIKWGVESGQLWQLGEHRLLCGDCTKAEDVARVMGGEKAELLFTSPPYSDIREYSGNDLSELHKFIGIFATHARYQVVNLGIKRRDGEVIPYWDAYIAEAKLAGLKLLSWNVWDKLLAGSISNQSAMFAIEHEWIFVFGSEPKPLNRTVEKSSDSEKRLKSGRRDTRGRIVRGVRQADGTMRDSVKGENYATKNLPSVIQLPPEMSHNITGEHPAVFPVALPSVYIEAMTNAGDCVAEPFSGSGTTIIACENLKRRCRAIEIAPGYVAVALERYLIATNKTPTLMA